MKPSHADAVTADGRRMVECLREPDVRPKGWPLKSRKPQCNRIAGHAGPHQERDRTTFDVRAEWS